MNKKKEFVAKKTGWRQANRVVLAIGVLLGISIIGFLVMNSQNSVPGVVAGRWQGGDYNIGQQISYQGQIVGMTEVSLEQAGTDLVGFPLQLVEEAKLVDTNYFYNGGNQRVPLICYISPAGRVVVAVGLCEPCQSESFHIGGDELVCDSCNTKWTLNELQGVSGGCTLYPPEELNYTVVDGMVLISESDLKSWKPRKL